MIAFGLDKLLTLVLRFSACLILIWGPSALADLDRFDLVIDLDWTLFYNIRAEQKDQVDHVVDFHGEFYRATDLADEFLKIVKKKYPQARLIVFSGGDEIRNKFLLKSLSLGQNQTALDITDLVFSKSHLVRGQDGKNKKRILNLAPEARIDRVAFIDDIVAYNDEGAKMIDSLGHLEFSPRFDVTKLGPFHPRTELEWRTERNKVGYWLMALQAWVEGKEISNDIPSVTREGMKLIYQNMQFSCRRIY